MFYWISIFLTVISGAASLAQDSPVDWRIRPGDRVGPISVTTTESDLRTLFGAESVTSIEVHLGEDFTAPGTAVYPDSPEMRIEIVWRSSERISPKEVRLTGTTSRWATDNGISLGTRLKEVEALNGYPFRLAGFDFDYAGTIVGCGKGRLLYLGCCSSDPKLTVRFASDQHPLTPEYLQLIGDRIFSSGHPAMQAVNPSIYQLVVAIDDE